MDPSELLPQVRHAHIGLVITSGTLFALRGIGLLAGAKWSMRPAVRMLSVLIDVALLGAALWLLAILQLNPFAVPWLATKIALLVLYVVLGTLTLKRARTRSARALWFAAALAVFGFMLSVAVAHHPLGALLWIIPPD